MQTLQDLANDMEIKHLCSLGKPAREAIEVADTAGFEVESLAHPAARLYSRSFLLSREQHDAAYTKLRLRNGNDKPCTTFANLRASEVNLAACIRGGEYRLR